jgi:DNA-directed RNA polymerase subunit K/omega
MQEANSKYRDILLIARRARQIESGARAMVDVHTRKAAKVAMEEMRAGKLREQRKA